MSKEDYKRLNYSCNVTYIFLVSTVLIFFRHINCNVVTYFNCSFTQVTINEASLGSIIDPQNVKLELGTLNTTVSDDVESSFNFSPPGSVYL